MAKKMTAKTVIKSKPEVPKTLKGLVVVVGTEKSQYMKTGKEYEVSPILANTLVKSGHATLKK